MLPQPPLRCVDSSVSASRAPSGVAAVRRAAWLTVGLVCLGTGHVADAAVTPLLTDIWYNPQRLEATAVLGYYNDSAAVVIPIGADNRFSSPPGFRGQVTSFQPGRVDDAFSVTFRVDLTPTLTWILQGQQLPITLGNARAQFSGDTNYQGGLIDRDTVILRNASVGTIANDPFRYPFSTKQLRIGSNATTNYDADGNFVGGRLTIDGSDASATGISNYGRIDARGSTLATPLIQNFALGEVIVSNTAIVKADALTNDGFVLIQGGSTTLGTIDNASMFDVTGGQADVESFTLRSTGTLRTSGGTLRVGSLTYQGGTVNLAGGSLSLGSGALETTAASPFGLNPTIGQGTRLRFEAGGASIAAGRSVGVSGAGHLLVQGGSNAGILNVTQGEFTVETKSFVNSVGGQINVIGGTLRSQEKAIVNHGSILLVNSTVDAALDTKSGSTVGIFGAADFRGNVSGNGRFTGNGVATFHAGYQPGGAAIGLIEHDGGAAFTPTALLALDLGGSARGSTYDAVNVAGTLTLGGALAVSLSEGYAPQFGDSYQLFRAGSLVGSFDQLMLPSLNQGLYWDTNNLTATGMLTVVPEPATFALLAMGGLPLLLRRRGREM